MARPMEMDELNFVQLLPYFMQNDDVDAALSAGIDELFGPLIQRIPSLSDWTSVDEMNSDQLNELAWEMGIPWYEQEADIESRRKVIKNFSSVIRKTGTKHAVEQILNDYFGNGYIEEWFEYGGEPGHYSVYCDNPDVCGTEKSRFLYLLGEVLRKSSKMDDVTIGFSNKANLYYGTCIQEYQVEEFACTKSM